MKLRIAYYGEPVLRKKAQPITEITPEIRQLAADMIETMHAVNGIGLAGPQVFQSKAIFVTHVPLLQNDGTWKPGPVRVYINPKILSYSQEMDELDDGCLSIPGLRGNVLRPHRVVVSATDLDGNEFQLELSGLEAYNICHENDHLNGVLYIDRIHRAERKKLEPYLQQIKKKYRR